jgi:hypothetical protein
MYDFFVKECMFMPGENGWAGIGWSKPPAETKSDPATKTQQECPQSNEERKLDEVSDSVSDVLHQKRKLEDQPNEMETDTLKYSEVHRAFTDPSDSMYAFLL